MEMPMPVEVPKHVALTHYLDVENMMTMTSNLKPCVVLVKVHRNTEMIIYRIYFSLDSFL